MKVIKDEELKKLIDKSLEADNPDILNEIMDSFVNAEESYDVKDYLYLFIDLTELMNKAIKDNKINFFLFLKEVFSEHEFIGQVNVIRREIHRVICYDKTNYEIEMKNYYIVEDDKIVLDSEKIKEEVQEESYNLDFENITEDWVSAIKGGYPVDYFLETEEEVEHVLDDIN